MSYLSRALSAAVLGTLLSTPAVAQETPVEADPGRVVLGATRKLRITDRVFVNGDITSVGTHKTVIGNDNDIVGSVYSIPALDIGHRTAIDGDVRSANDIRIANSALVDPEQIDTLSGGIFNPGGLGGTGGDGQRFLTLSPDRSGTLTEDYYHRVTVFSRAELTIPAGNTVIDHLTVEPGATIILDNADGPIKLFVNQSLTFRGDWAPVVSTPLLDLQYTGERSLLLETSFRGNVVAPFSTLILGGNNTEFEGSFFADSIVVRPGVAVSGVRNLPQEEKDKEKDKK